MRKRKIIFLAIGIICLLSGIVMAVLHVAPEIIPTTMIFTGTFLITFIPTWFWMRTYTKDGTLILDEMVRRVNDLSGKYSFIASLFFIFALCIINYFYPLPLSINGLLVIMMLFMSLSFFLIRLYLLRRGVTE